MLNKLKKYYNIINSLPPFLKRGAIIFFSFIIIFNLLFILLLVKHIIDGW